MLYYGHAEVYEISDALKRRKIYSVGRLYVVRHNPRNAPNFFDVGLKNRISRMGSYRDGLCVLDVVVVTNVMGSITGACQILPLLISATGN